MENILCIVQTEGDGSLAKAALEAVSVAKELAQGLAATFAVGLLGQDVQAGRPGSERQMGEQAREQEARIHRGGAETPRRFARDVMPAGRSYCLQRYLCASAPPR